MSITASDRYAPVGDVVFNAYWGESYTVTAHNADGSVSVRWHGKHDALNLDRFPAGREGTHRTPLDARDLVLGPRVEYVSADGVTVGTGDYVFCIDMDTVLIGRATAMGWFETWRNRGSRSHYELSADRVISIPRARSMGYVA